MSPELTKEVIVGIFTALATGIPAVALFWWTYQRDQERLIVQKLLSRWKTAEGGTVLEKHPFGILIRNRSLFSVHVSSLGFEIDGQVIELEHSLFPMRMKRNPDPNSNYPYVGDEDFDPRTIPSLASIHVSLGDEDRPAIATALLAAATKRNVSVEELLVSPNVVAVVWSETGRAFTSMPFFKKVKRLLEKALSAPQGGAMNLAFVGILVNAIGSLVLVFTPLVAGYGGPIMPAHVSWWRIGWGLLVIGFGLQAVAAYKRTEKAGPGPLKG